MPNGFQQTYRLPIRVRLLLHLDSLHWLSRTTQHPPTNGKAFMVMHVWMGGLLDCLGEWIQSWKISQHHVAIVMFLVIEFWLLGACWSLMQMDLCQLKITITMVKQRWTVGFAGECITCSWFHCWMTLPYWIGKERRLLIFINFFLFFHAVVTMSLFFLMLWRLCICFILIRCRDLSYVPYQLFQALYLFTDFEVCLF